MSHPTEDPGTPLTNAVIARLPQLCPQIESFVPDGWDAVAAQALEAIALLANETGVPILIAQFKEKFGDFRIYVSMDEPSIGRPASGIPDTVRARAMEIIDDAAARCSTICQQCGSPGRKRCSECWRHVACNEHAHR